MKDAVVEVNTMYGSTNYLKDSTNSRILEAMLYYQIKDKHLAVAFKKWVIENHIYAIEEPEILEKYEANELVSVFDRIMESRKRTIFVSMQFDEITIQNYEAIKQVVDSLNDEIKLDLKLREIRIDELDKGYSYKITTEIQNLVETCGFLIADLSLGNMNVYQEVGYLMGLNRGKLNEQNNFILVHNKEIPGSDFEKDVGFNIKDYKY